MIEKLKTINPYDETEIDMDVNSVAGLVYENTPLIQKINELVDAVNWLGQSTTEIRPETTYELYLQNKHLIGKLCKFKCAGGYSYGILTNIKRKPCQWPFESLGRAFSTCEPVKPDDDIIYKDKGGDNVSE